MIDWLDDNADTIIGYLIGAGLLLMIGMLTYLAVDWWRTR